VFGRNINKSKVEVRTGIKHFLSNVFLKFYIVIWSWMKLEDVLKVLPMFKDFWSNYSGVLLLYKGFETCVLCLLWATLWDRISNITN
jgi:hypothetical protein